jgi:transposase
LLLLTPRARTSSPPAVESDGMGLSHNHRRKKVTSRADKDTGRKSSEPPEPGVFQKIPEADRDQLRKWTRRRSSPHRLVVRSRIVLLAAEGLNDAAIATNLRVSAATVRLWRTRFAAGGLAALMSEAPGRGRRSGSSPAVTIAALEATRSLLGDRLTVRRVAAQAGTSASTVWRLWRRYGLGPNSSRDAVEAVLRRVISETLTPSG